MRLPMLAGLVVAAVAFPAAAETATLHIGLRNAGAGTFDARHTVRLTADCTEQNRYDVSASWPQVAVAPGEGATTTVQLHVHDGFVGTFSLAVSWIDANGSNRWLAARDVRFERGTFYWTEAGVTRADPGVDQYFALANLAPDPVDIRGCYGNPPNADTDLYIYWDAQAHAGDFLSRVVESAPSAEGPWRVVRTLAGNAFSNVTVQGLTCRSNSTYRVVTTDRYGATGTGAPRVCTLDGCEPGAADAGAPARDAGATRPDAAPDGGAALTDSGPLPADAGGEDRTDGGAVDSGSGIDGDTGERPEREAERAARCDSQCIASGYSGGAWRNAMCMCLGETAAPPPEEGCGCSGAGPLAMLWLLPIVGLARRRRRGETDG